MKRTFLQWFVITLAYVVGAFFAFFYDLPQAIWAGDVTHMSAVIGVVFVLTAAYLGHASWVFDAAEQQWGIVPEYLCKTEAAIGLGRTASFIITLIGLLGTAIGLMFQVKAMASVDVASSQSVLAFVSAIGGALATALYATSCGIAGCIGITVLTANLEHALERVDK